MTGSVKPSAPVSVIMPAYMAEKTVGRALESVARQTILPAEVIVVDDGSGDGTADAAEAARDHMAGINLTVIRQDHQGAGAARNRALKEARFAYVAFLDADDEWLPEKLDRSIKVLEETGSVLVSHDYIRRNPDGTENVVLNCSLNFGQPGDPYTRLYRQGYIATSGVVAKLDAVLAAGGFDETLPTAQDFALWLSMLGKPGTSFQIFPGAFLRYHISPGGITRQTERRLRCTMEIAERFYPTLFGRPGFPLASLWYRIIAVHYEAASVYLTEKRFKSAAGVILRVPFNLVKSTISRTTDAK